MQKISFEVNGETLQGSLFYPEKPKSKNPAVLFLHGWRSSEKNILGRAEALAKLGFVCMSFNMRANGTSEGDITTLSRKDFLKDAITAYDFLINLNNVDKEQVSVIGSSFGAYLATLLTRERSIKNLVLRVPANYPDEGFDEPQIEFSGDNEQDILQWRFNNLANKKTYSIEALQKFSGDVLIVESENDELIPHILIENYLSAVKDKSKVTHKVIKGADHAIHNEKLLAAYDTILTAWFMDKD